MGQPQGDDPFAAQMSEATRRPSVDRERTDSGLQKVPLPIESVDDELADETSVDSKQRRIKNALQSGDIIEDCFVSRTSVDIVFYRTESPLWFGFCRTSHAPLGSTVLVCVVSVCVVVKLVWQERLTRQTFQLAFLSSGENACTS
jgi:hypothetical protein